MLFSWVSEQVVAQCMQYGSIAESSYVGLSANIVVQSTALSSNQWSCGKERNRGSVMSFLLRSTVLKRVQ